LPLVPGFLGYLSGVLLTETSRGTPKVFYHTVFFVLGFSCVFALLGVLLNTIFLNVSYTVKVWLGRTGGTIIILFGLYLLGLLRFRFLETEQKIPLKGLSLPPTLFSFVFGAVFGVSWTPCVGLS